MGEVHELAEGFGVDYVTAEIILALHSRAHHLTRYANRRAMAGPDHRDDRRYYREERKECLRIAGLLRDKKLVITNA